MRGGVGWVRKTGEWIIRDRIAGPNEGDNMTIKPPEKDTVAIILEGLVKLDDAAKARDIAEDFLLAYIADARITEAYTAIRNRGGKP